MPTFETSTINSMKKDNFNKTIYYLGLCELVLSSMNKSDNFQSASQIIKNCWEWNENKTQKADELYNYLENLEDTGILTLMQFDKEKDFLNAWICIGNATLYVTKKAYEYQKDCYFPQTIEAIEEDELLNEFRDNFIKISKGYDIVEKEFIKFLNNNENDIKKADIIAFLISKIEELKVKVQVEKQ